MRQWIAVSCHVEDKKAARLLVGLLEVEPKRITWHVLASTSVEQSDDVVGQLGVILSGLRWRRGAIDASDTCFITFDNVPRTWTHGLHDFVRDHGLVSREPSRYASVDESIARESVLSVVHKSSSIHWMSAPYAGLLLSTLYASLDMLGDVLGNPRIENAFKLVVHDHVTPIRDTLRIDDMARAAVEGHFSREVPSVVDLLRRFCHTKRGAECARQRILAPETNFLEISSRQDVVEEILHLMKVAEWYAAKSIRLLGIVDHGDRRFQWFTSPLNKPSGSNPALKDWRGFCEWIADLRAEISQLDSVVSEMMSNGSKLCKRFIKAVIERITSIWDTFCLSTIKVINEFEGSERSGAAEHNMTIVQEVRHNLKRCELMIHKHRDEVAAELLLHPERVKIEEDDTLSVQGIQLGQAILFRVTRQDAHRVLQALARTTTTGFRQAHSRRTSGVWFTTDRLGALVAERYGLLQALHRLELQVTSSLTATYNEVVRAKSQEVVSTAAELDVLTACAQLSICHNFVRPKLSDSRDIKIVGLRWPHDSSTVPAKSCDSCEGQLRVSSHGRDKILKLCQASPMLLLHSSVDDDASIPVRLAMTVVLNQIGCFVPCTSATLPVFDSLFLRVGAFDYIMKNQSTFLNEMQQMSKILTRAGRQSLVLMDELCRGTSPSEGMPLAVEICRHLTENVVFTCVTTQWTELVHALLPNERVAVPIIYEEEPREGSKTIYRQCLAQCDQRFLASMQALDFPAELLEMVEEELQRG